MGGLGRDKRKHCFYERAEVWGTHVFIIEVMASQASVYPATNLPVLNRCLYLSKAVKHSPCSQCCYSTSQKDKRRLRGAGRLHSAPQASDWPGWDSNPGGRDQRAPLSGLLGSSGPSPQRFDVICHVMDRTCFRGGGGGERRKREPTPFFPSPSPPATFPGHPTSAFCHHASVCIF